VVFLSYKRQYPSFLYPGASQLNPTQEKVHVENEPVLDLLNPFSWWQISRRVKREQPDLVILNWVTVFLMPQFVLITSLIRRWTNARIIVVCHNVKQHETWVGERTLTKLALRNAHYLLTHSDEDCKAGQRLLPTAIVLKVPLPPLAFPDEQSYPREKARRELGITADRVLLFFGFVREYKGLEYLLRAMPAVCTKLPLHLLVVGEFWQDKRKYLDLVEELHLTDAVTVVDKYVPDEEVPRYFAACDAVVLPYTSATQSGIIPLAYSYGRPVITTRVGGLPEVVAEGQSGLLVPPRDVTGLANAIKYLYSEDNLARMSRNVSTVLERFSWEKVVDVVDQLETHSASKPTKRE